jgi:hypothetical protein
VSDDQVIAQAIKALRVGALHSHLVRELVKIVSELHEQFAKFSKSEVQHFHKLEQERKVAKPDLIIVITNTTTRSLCTTSTLMVVGHQRTGRRTSEGLHRKETYGLSIRDPPPNTTREAKLQTMVGGAAEAYTQ